VRRARERERAIWREYAFCARYGHQQIDTLRGLTRRELEMLRAELGELVRHEPMFTLKSE
jgi:hypothetical protein